MKKVKIFKFLLPFVVVIVFIIGLAKIVPAQPSVSVHLTLGNPSNAGTFNLNNYLLVKPQYVIGYNCGTGRANWVSWQLNSSWLDSTSRQDNFRADTTLPSGCYQVQSTDFSGSGFDRGHMTPSGDRTSKA